MRSRWRGREHLDLSEIQSLVIAKIGPMKRVARMLRGHRLLILNWFRDKGQLSSGVVECFNAKAKPHYQKGL